MGRGVPSSSSSSFESSNYPSVSSKSSFSQRKKDLSTDLRLGLSISASQQDNPSTPSDQQQLLDWPPIKPFLRKALASEENECSSATFFVKVYMEGIPIGRKLNLLAHDGPEMDIEHSGQCHVLTYEDREGDWLIVGDVPWEMFLPSVRRLKITRADSL
ncbi:hypothetical protein SADUNF_Sadunf14G0081400 [Salix dunnii]|uniref:Auxin-responsive protein n=1 Tax=Salix dunnii TaxID=1413687 RepID=A0A835JIB7_9ROSI|nr:hypothetical protein SADUNF_Sadunf14G0081400 [Salix dunnii]